MRTKGHTVLLNLLGIIIVPLEGTEFVAEESKRTIIIAYRWISYSIHLPLDQSRMWSERRAPSIFGRIESTTEGQFSTQDGRGIILDGANLCNAYNISIFRLFSSG